MKKIKKILRKCFEFIINERLIKRHSSFRNLESKINKINEASSLDPTYFVDYASKHGTEEALRQLQTTSLKLVARELDTLIRIGSDRLTYLARRDLLFKNTNSDNILLLRNTIRNSLLIENKLPNTYTSKIEEYLLTSKDSSTSWMYLSYLADLNENDKCINLYKQFAHFLDKNTISLGALKLLIDLKVCNIISEEHEVALSAYNYMLNSKVDLSSAINHETKVAVIGKSPKALTDKDGNLIDSSDHVIRFNDFLHVQKLNEFLGAKTTIWSTAMDTPVSDRVTKTQGIQYIWPCCNLSRKIWDPALLKTYSEYFKKNKPKVIFAESNPMILAEKASILWPSSGLFVLWSLLSITDTDNIFYKGFSFKDSSKAWGARHYNVSKEDKSINFRGSWHSWKNEHSFAKNTLGIKL